MFIRFTYIAALLFRWSYNRRINPKDNPHSRKFSTQRTKALLLALTGGAEILLLLAGIFPEKILSPHILSIYICM